MKLPKGFKLVEYSENGIYGVVKANNEKSVLCYVTDRLAKKEDAELVFEGKISDKFSATDKIVLDYKNEDSRATYKIDETFSKLKNSSDSGFPIIIRTDDLTIRNTSNLFFDSDLKGEAIEFDSLNISDSSISLIFGTQNSYGRVNINKVERATPDDRISFGSVDLSGSKTDINLDNLKLGASLYFMREASAGVTGRRRISITNFDLYSKNDGVDALLFQVGGNVDVSDVSLFVRDSLRTEILVEEDFKLAVIESKADKTQRAYLTFNSELNGLKAHSFKATLTPNSTDKPITHNLGFIKATNVDIEIDHSNQRDAKIKIDNLDLTRNDSAEPSFLKVCGSLDSIVSGRICFYEKERLGLTVNGDLKLEYGANLFLRKEGVKEVRDLFIRNATVDALRCLDGSNELRGSTQILAQAEFNLNFSATDLKVGKDTNFVCLTTLRKEKQGGDELKVSMNNVEFDGVTNKLIFTLEPRRQVKYDIRDCTFGESGKDSKIQIFGNYYFDAKNSIFKGDCDLRSVNAVIDSVLQSSKLQGVREVLGSDLSNSEYENIQKIETYMGFSEKVENKDSLTVEGVADKKVILRDKTNIGLQTPKIKKDEIEL